MFKWLTRALCKEKTIIVKDPIIASLEEAAKRVWKESNNKVLVISEPVTSFLKCFKQNSIHLLEKNNAHIHRRVSNRCCLGNHRCMLLHHQTVG